MKEKKRNKQKAWVKIKDTETNHLKSGYELSEEVEVSAQ